MRYVQKSGGHAGTPNRDGKPYLGHVPSESLTAKHNGKHSDHPTNNMTMHNLHQNEGTGGVEDSEEGME